MSKLVERVARALLMTDFGDLDEHGADYVMAAKGHRGDCTKEPFSCARCTADTARNAARAAIDEVLSEMGEPSEEVLRAVADALTKPRVHVGHVRSDRVADAAIALQAAAGQFSKEVEG